MSPVDDGKNIVKHRLSSGEVVLPNQRCWHRTVCKYNKKIIKIPAEKFIF